MEKSGVHKPLRHDAVAELFDIDMGRLMSQHRLEPLDRIDLVKQQPDSCPVRHAGRVLHNRAGKIDQDPRGKRFGTQKGGDAVVDGIGMTAEFLCGFPLVFAKEKLVTLCLQTRKRSVLQWIQLFLFFRVKRAAEGDKCPDPDHRHQQMPANMDQPHKTMLAYPADPIAERAKSQPRHKKRRKRNRQMNNHMAPWDPHLQTIEPRGHQFVGIKQSDPADAMRACPLEKPEEGAERECEPLTRKRQGGSHAEHVADRDALQEKGDAEKRPGKGRVG